MTETKNNDERFPEVKPTKPGNDTAYIAPIIGKLGYDTRRPWLFGLGTSPNNGVDFHVFLSFDGLNFDDNDIDKIWNGGTADKVKKEVDSATAEIPAAVSAANSAVSAAESAVAASKVNSDAIVAQSEAISEAKSAMDSATAEIQQTAANTDAKITANSTAIDQANKQISLKADQTEVDQVKQTATQNSSRLNVMANEISSKVTSTDVNNIVDKKGYATTSTVQSLITQNAGTINESITSLNAKYNTTVTQVQSLTASIDGLQSTVKDKADKSQITQLSNLVQSKVSTSDFTSKVSQLSNDINARVTKGDLLSQINLEAGQTLIQSKKIFLDADTVAFSGKAFIPSAAITSLDADKITSGYIKVPMSDGNGNSVQVSNNGVDILSNNKESKLFNANRGIASVHIDAAGMNFGATTNGTYELLGGLSPLLDDTDGDFGGMSNHNGIGFVVETQQQYGSPYGGDFFSLARSIKGPPSYYNGFLYEATGSGKHEIGSHFFDPIWIHPWGADNYMHATWVSWTAWDNNEKYPAIVQAGSNMGGICFPKSGEVTLFTASGKSFTPSQWRGVYTDYEHAGAGQSYLDPSYGA